MTAPADSAPAGDEAEEFVEDEIAPAGEEVAVAEEADVRSAPGEDQEGGGSPEPESDSVSSGEEPAAEDAEEETRSENEA